jgi:hypothetical protein
MYFYNFQCLFGVYWGFMDINCVLIKVCNHCQIYFYFFGAYQNLFTQHVIAVYWDWSKNIYSSISFKLFIFLKSRKILQNTSFPIFYFHMSKRYNNTLVKKNYIIILCHIFLFFLKKRKIWHIESYNSGYYYLRFLLWENFLVYL